MTGAAAEIKLEKLQLVVPIIF